MDLRDRLWRTAVKVPVVLVAALPGATEVRLEAEAELRRRGWPSADAPAGANLLVVCGNPFPDRDRQLDTVQRNMPQPAVRVVVPRPGDTPQALDAGLARLRASGNVPSGGEPRHGDGGGHGSPSGHRGAGDAASEGPSDSGSTPAAHDHSPHHDGEHTEHDAHGGHADHHAHAMSTVAGLPMADRADDRDGLRLDQLHLPIGPMLADWPAGLILRCALQGDIVQEVHVDRLPPPPGTTSFWNEPWLRASHGEPVTLGIGSRRRCAAHLDSLGRLLAVAGWADPAVRLRRLRDDVLAGAPGVPCGERLRALARRIQRSRTLHWSLTGLGRLPAERARPWGVTGPALVADGDVHDRLLVWLREAERATRDFDDVRLMEAGQSMGPRGAVGGAGLPSQALLDVLPGLLTGAEFGGARLVVASLDPDLDEPVAVSAAEGAHG
ncbi:hypothetical protein ABZ348_23400 [Streptomyces sp. NPDC005963]|uniref:hypothetical protein n=1 Tax=Streptomyces sp. NPDC005963 TaxID=3156721 RepID=UPI0033EB35A5